ncbi:hypothetical protein ACWEKM_31385 [Streptomyces sp. NPDC004752]
MWDFSGYGLSREAMYRNWYRQVTDLDEGGDPNSLTNHPRWPLVTMEKLARAGPVPGDGPALLGPGRSVGPVGRLDLGLQ